MGETMIDIKEISLGDEIVRKEVIHETSSPQWVETLREKVKKKIDKNTITVETNKGSMKDIDIRYGSVKKIC